MRAPTSSSASNSTSRLQRLRHIPPYAPSRFSKQPRYDLSAEQLAKDAAIIRDHFLSQQDRLREIYSSNGGTGSGSTPPTTLSKVQNRKKDTNITLKATTQVSLQAPTALPSTSLFQWPIPSPDSAASASPCSLFGSDLISPVATASGFTTPDSSLTPADNGSNIKPSSSVINFSQIATESTILHTPNTIHPTLPPHSEHPHPSTIPPQDTAPPRSPCPFFGDWTSLVTPSIATPDCVPTGKGDSDSGPSATALGKHRAVDEDSIRPTELQISGSLIYPFNTFTADNVPQGSSSGDCASRNTGNQQGKDVFTLPKVTLKARTAAMSKKHVRYAGFCPFCGKRFSRLHTVKNHLTACVKYSKGKGRVRYSTCGLSLAELVCAHREGRLDSDLPNQPPAEITRLDNMVKNQYGGVRPSELPAHLFNPTDTSSDSGLDMATILHPRDDAASLTNSSTSSGNNHAQTSLQQAASYVNTMQPPPLEPQHWPIDDPQTQNGCINGGMGQPFALPMPPGMVPFPAAHEFQNWMFEPPVWNNPQMQFSQFSLPDMPMSTLEHAGLSEQIPMDDVPELIPEQNLGEPTNEQQLLLEAFMAIIPMEPTPDIPVTITPAQILAQAEAANTVPILEDLNKEPATSCTTSSLDVSGEFVDWEAFLSLPEL